MDAQKCINPEVGAMIHAYELGVLSAEDTERFETHLLNCPFCFAEIKRFEASADILRSDETVKDEIRQSSGSSERNRWREYLWPKRPLILRPAFLLLLILILAYPAYRGLIPSHKSAIGPLQTIVLSPTRATSAPTLCVSLRRDGVISFLYRDADPNVQYRITIKSDDDHEILVVPSFDAFDEYGVGSILFPADLMHSGSYRLEIVPETGDHADDRQVYPFRIE